MGPERQEILTPQWTFPLLCPSLLWKKPYGSERLKSEIPDGKFLLFMLLHLSDHFFLPATQPIKAMRKNPNCNLTLHGLLGGCIEQWEFLVKTDHL